MPISIWRGFGALFARSDWLVDATRKYVMTTVMTAVTNNRRIGRSELKAKIYETALGLFRKCGYGGVSIDEIVEAAGVAKGTFFNFFPTKLHVLKAYYAEIDVEIAKRRSRLDVRKGAAALVAYARDVEKILRREGALMIELLGQALHEPEMRRIDEDSGSIDKEEFVVFFRQMAKEGAIRHDVDPDLAAEVLIDLWAGSVRAWLQATDQLSLAKLFKSKIQLLFLGMEPTR